MKSARLRSITRDATGALAGALTVVPIILSCGAVLYESMGAAWVTAGISAAFVAAVVAAIVTALLGKTPLHMNSPKTTHAAILLGLIASVATDPSFASANASGGVAPILIACTALLVSGIVQTILGASRLGLLVKFVPYPVLAGFINGFAIQIILNQLPRALDIDGPEELLRALNGTVLINWWALGFALVSGAFVVLAKKRSGPVPAALIGLFAGTAIQMLCLRLVPDEDLGATIGALPPGIPLILRMTDILNFVSSADFYNHAAVILATGITIALVSSIQSLLSISSTEQLFGARHNSNRELVVQGVSNIASALFGGAPSGGSPNITRIVHASGGRTGVTNLMYACALLALSYGLSQVVGHIPLSVMAGVVIVTSAEAMDKWTHQLLRAVGYGGHSSTRRETFVNLAMVFVVTVLVVFASVLVALGVGFAAALIAFIYRSNAQMIRRIQHATQLRSRTRRSRASVEALGQHGRRIAIVELDGPLFFGSAERVERVVSDELSGSDWVLLNLKRISHFDSSGVLMLKRLDELLVRSGRRLLFAPRHFEGRRRKSLAEWGLTKPEAELRVFDSTDAALSQAEDELLDKLAVQECDQEIDLAAFPVTQEMNDDERALLLSLATRRSFAAGEIVIGREGPRGGLLLLTRGRLSALWEKDEKTLRTASYRAGMALGEIPSMQERQRLVKLVADTPAVLLELSQDALAHLRTTMPGLDAKLMRNLSIEIGYRLCDLLETIRDLEGD
ncbi:SulP family inorganic anion transporter [Caballeronia sordidicola]|uniref:Sulfate permease n=1 Tax=Caballeronia sordidicola TaxID=196367 RepID=A0A226WTK9_CABSO|nr:SulP family inorganic anion transporter [Caballeronia sordidicola]OXC74546.1 Sulfate permease [Caballeronia sordidicola]